MEVAGFYFKSKNLRIILFHISFNIFCSFCCNYQPKLFIVNFLVLRNLECSETGCLQNFFMIIFFSTIAFSLWQMTINTAAVCKSKVSAERVVKAVAWYSTQCLLETALRIYLTDSPSITYGPAVYGIVITVEYIDILHWWYHSLIMMTLALSSSLDLRHLIFFLKAFLTLCWT